MSYTAIIEFVGHAAQFLFNVAAPQVLCFLQERRKLGVSGPAAIVNLSSSAL